jgi:hypothetical protein
MRLCALLCSLVVVGCGGDAKPPAEKPTPDPIRDTAGPSCKDVIAHLATLADRDPTKDPKSDNTLRARCESDKWSDDARSCFATASADTEVDGCKTKLTAAQLAAFPKPAPTPAADPWAAKAGGAAADSKPEAPKDSARHSRGPVQKKGRAGDPCEGGE